MNTPLDDDQNPTRPLPGAPVRAHRHHSEPCLGCDEHGLLILGDPGQIPTIWRCPCDRGLRSTRQYPIYVANNCQPRREAP
jgi:hypothetical protein